MSRASNPGMNWARLAAAAAEIMGQDRAIDPAVRSAATEGVHQTDCTEPGGADHEENAEFLER